MPITYYNTYFGGRLIAIFYDKKLVDDYIKNNKKCRVDEITLEGAKCYYEYTEIDSRFVYALRFKHDASYAKHHCFARIEDGYIVPHLKHFTPRDYSTFEKHEAIEMLSKFYHEKLEVVKIKLNYE